MDDTSQHKVGRMLTGMMHEARQQAEALTPPPPTPWGLRLDELEKSQAGMLKQLQRHLQALQTTQQQMQQQLLRQSQQIEELRSFVLKIGQITTRTEKRLIQQPRKKSWWTHWIS